MGGRQALATRQYQYTLQGSTRPGAQRMDAEAPAALQKRADTLRRRQQRPAEQGAWQANLVIDRDAAFRLGIT
jgi:hypothetical protein